jgi:SAM-dependent methyltransferase
MAKPRTRTTEAQLWAALSEWLKVEPGSLVADAEMAALAEVLPDLFGYHLLQIGAYPLRSYTAASRITHQVVCRVGGTQADDTQCELAADSDALPLAQASVDVVVLPHTLDLAATPHGVLREVERVLVGEGHVVIICFNPLSLWGIWRLFVAWRDRVPWSVRFFSVARIRDWLTLLGFEITEVRRFVFRPPLKRPGFNRRLLFLEKLGDYCWPLFGAVYLIVGRKRIISATPIRVNWRSRRRLLGSGVIEPSTRA